MTPFGKSLTRTFQIAIVVLLALVVLYPCYYCIRRWTLTIDGVKIDIMPTQMEIADDAESADLEEVSSAGTASVEKSSHPREYPAPSYPLPEQVGNWDIIRERLFEWEFVDFNYGGGIADGGSLGFDFKTSKGEEVMILVACASWWTEQDWERKRQPIFLSYKRKDYRVEEGTEIETRLIEILDHAASHLKGEGPRDPKYIARLRDLIQKRNFPNEIWPYDDIEAEEELGDWSEIEERMARWEFSAFHNWGDLGDHISDVFRFQVSNGSEVGIVVAARDWIPDDENSPTDNTATPLTDPFALGAEEESYSMLIFVHFEKKLYLVLEDSDEEMRLLELLDRAVSNLSGAGTSDPKYIQRLRDMVASREPTGDLFWPMTDEEASGD